MPEPGEQALDSGQARALMSTSLAQRLPWLALLPAPRVATGLMLLALFLSWAALALFAAGVWIATLIVGTGAIGSLRAAFTLAGLTSTSLRWSTQPIAAPRQADLRRGRAALIVACGAILLAAIHLWRSPSIDPSLLLFPAALLACWCGESWLDGTPLSTRLQTLTAGLLRRRWEILAVLGISLAGLALRLWMAQQYPFTHGSLSDESLVGGQAYALAHGTDSWPLYATMGGAVALFQPIAAAFLFFGANMDVFRVTPVFESALIVPAFYLLARQFVAVPAALCASALLALAYWPAMLSIWTFGWLNGAVLQAVGTALVVYSARRRSITAGAAGGMVVAVCLYSYLGHRFMPLPAMIFLLGFLILGPGTVRDRLGPILGFAVGFLGAALPWIGLISGNSSLLYGDSTGLSQPFRASFQQQPLATLGNTLSAMKDLALSLVGADNGDWLIFPGSSHAALLGGLCAALVFLGVAYALARPRQWVNLVLLPALLLPLVVTAISVTNLPFITYRLNSIVVAVFLAIAVLLNHCWDLAALQRVGARWGATTLIVLAGFSAITNVHRVTAQLSDCSVMGYDGPLGEAGAEGPLVAEMTNDFGAHHATFVISDGWQEWIWSWLFHAAPPEIQTRPTIQDPAQWRILYAGTGGSGGATFWPPRLAPGQTALTYIITPGAILQVVPILRQALPAGTVTRIQPARCPTFALTAFTVSAHEIRQYATPARTPQLRPNDDTVLPPAH